jgi:hypothetical protein
MESIPCVFNTAGNYDQSGYSIAIGNNAGSSNQSRNSVAIGNKAGGISQGTKSVAIGYQAGKTNQSRNSVAIGSGYAMHLEGSGNVIIGYNLEPSSTSVNKELKVGSDNITWISGNSYNNDVGYVGINGAEHSSEIALNVNGTIYASSEINSSDDRIKYNEQDINGTTAINVINQLNPQKYEKIIQHPQDTNGVWIPTDIEWSETERDTIIDITDDEGNTTTKPKWNWSNEIGLIAQDIKLINELKDSVNGEEVDANGNQTTLSLNYNDIFTYHIAATKQLINELNSIKIRVAQLESQLGSDP